VQLAARSDLPRGWLCGEAGTTEQAGCHTCKRSAGPTAYRMRCAQSGCVVHSRAALCTVGLRCAQPGCVVHSRAALCTVGLRCAQSGRAVGCFEGKQTGS
jgi:hypothetical protein